MRASFGVVGLVAVVVLSVGCGSDSDDDDGSGGHGQGGTGSAGQAGQSQSGNGGSAAAGAGAGGMGGSSAGTGGVGGTSAGAGGVAGANAGAGGASAGAGGSDAAGRGGASAGAGSGGIAGMGGLAGTGGMVDPATHFTFQFDYRFDTMGMFDDPERRRLLEYAGEIWAAHIADEFEDVPEGTEVLVRNPEDYETMGSVFTIDYAIDDILVFAGFAEHDGAGGELAGARASAAIGSVTDAELAARFDTRFNGPKFQPWTGWVSFDVADPYFYDPTPDTADDIPADKIDFLTVAYHELGHILGVGGSDAWDSLLDGETFIGTHAVAAYGGPVPLASGSTSHFDDAIMSDGRRMTMDQSDPPGERFPPTTLDLAVLADLGYTIR